jgi:hypothetical protein
VLVLRIQVNATKNKAISAELEQHIPSDLTNDAELTWRAALAIRVMMRKIAVKIA